MKLIFARLYADPMKLEVGIEEPPGRRRVINVTILSNVEGTVFPPANWLEVVKGEVKYQIAEEHAKSRGFIRP